VASLHAAHPGKYQLQFIAIHYDPFPCYRFLCPDVLFRILFTQPFRSDLS